MRPRTRSPVVRFGAFEIDLRSGELYKHGIRIQLRDKSAGLLEVLLERPGEVVTRQELRDRLWPPDVFVDFENSINTAVARLREALGESAERPGFIETLPRRGYRFIGPVVKPVAKARLAVLPFENLSGDPEQEYFSDGLTEEIITQLAAAEQLSVIARTTAMHYKRSPKPVAEIGAELGLDYVVEGSVRRSGGRVRVTAQLIRASDQTHLWARNYDAELRDILAVQAEVARAVAGEIRVAFTAAQRAPAVEPEAHDAYILGLHWLNHGAFDTANQYFRRALDLDRRFAPAYAKLAMSHTMSGYFAHAPFPDSFLRAESAARLALELDETLADARLALAVVYWLHHWNFAACRRELECLVKLHPNEPGGHWALAVYYGALEEDPERALVEAHLTEELDPLNMFLRTTGCGWVRYWARHFDRAVEHGKETLKMDPDSLQALALIGWSAAAARRFDVAIPALETAVQKGGDLFSMAGLGMARGASGDRAGADLILNRLHERATSAPVPAICFAWVHMGLADASSAIHYLEKAVEEHDAQVLCVRVSPSADPIRADPRFQRLVDRLPLPRCTVR